MVDFAKNTIFNISPGRKKGNLTSTNLTTTTSSSSSSQQVLSHPVDIDKIIRDNPPEIRRILLVEKFVILFNQGRIADAVEMASDYIDYLYIDNEDYLRGLKSFDDLHFIDESPQEPTTPMETDTLETGGNTLETSGNTLESDSTNKKGLFIITNQLGNSSPPKKFLSPKAEIDNTSNPLNPSSLYTQSHFRKIVKFISTVDGLDKDLFGQFIGRNDNPLSINFLNTYSKSLRFSQLSIDEGLRLFLSRFKLPGEAQMVYRILERFAASYSINNTWNLTSDECHVLAYSIIMLNVDLHNAQIKTKIKKETFARSHRDLLSKLSIEDLHDIYDRVLAKEFTSDITLSEEAYKRLAINSNMLSASLENEYITKYDLNILTRGEYFIKFATYRMKIKSRILTIKPFNQDERRPSGEIQSPSLSTINPFNYSLQWRRSPTISSFENRKRNPLTALSHRQSKSDGPEGKWSRRFETCRRSCQLLLTGQFTDDSIEYSEVPKLAINKFKYDKEIPLNFLVDLKIGIIPTRIKKYLTLKSKKVDIDSTRFITLFFAVDAIELRKLYEFRNHYQSTNRARSSSSVTTKFSKYFTMTKSTIYYLTINIVAPYSTNFKTWVKFFHAILIENNSRRRNDWIRLKIRELNIPTEHANISKNENLRETGGSLSIDFEDQEAVDILLTNIKKQQYTEEAGRKLGIWVREILPLWQLHWNCAATLSGSSSGSSSGIVNIKQFIDKLRLNTNVVSMNTYRLLRIDNSQETEHSNNNQFVNNIFCCLVNRESNSEGKVNVSNTSSSSLFHSSSFALDRGGRFETARSTLVVSLWLLGLPGVLRPKLWPIALSNHQKIEYETSFEHYRQMVFVLCLNSPRNRQILQRIHDDIDTFSAPVIFHDKELICEILALFCIVYRPDVSYSSSSMVAILNGILIGLDNCNGLGVDNANEAEWADKYILSGSLNNTRHLSSFRNSRENMSLANLISESSSDCPCWFDLSLKEVEVNDYTTSLPVLNDDSFIIDKKSDDLKNIRLKKLGFTIFTNLMHSFYFLDFALVKQRYMKMRFDFFELCLKQYLPGLYTHFNLIQVSPQTYFLSWLQYFFTNVLPMSICLKIWDAIFLLGEVHVFSVAIALLSLYEHQLMMSGFDACVNLLTNVPLEHVFEEDVFFRFMSEIRVSPDKYGVWLAAQRLSEEKGELFELLL